jgi:7,8-dihydropterin-6-yl-methyl-4-(beta-D-ribofuranosyl)aminobenzene 5'-phosphate synthase
MNKWAVLFVLIAGMMLPFGSARAQEDSITFTIIYDNYEHHAGCRTDWGFSCLVEGFEKTILFDTGTREDIFAGNAEALDVELDRVGVVVVSHFHGDHTGGMDAFFEKKTDVPIYVPDDTGEYALLLSEGFREAGAEVVAVSGEREIMTDVFLTGTLGDSIKEQALVLKTGKGLVVVTGCAHPGIVTILKKAREMFPEEKMALVFGGFHLSRTSEATVSSIIEEFRDLGVEKVGATHCTGDRAIRMFADAYGSDFIRLGAGRIIKF